MMIAMPVKDSLIMPLILRLARLDRRRRLGLIADIQNKIFIKSTQFKLTLLT